MITTEQVAQIAETMVEWGYQRFDEDVFTICEQDGYNLDEEGDDYTDLSNRVLISFLAQFASADALEAAAQQRRDLDDLTRS